MENLIAFQLQFIHWFQGLGEWLTPIMEFFTFTGVEYFYLLVAPAIYWCWDTKLGLQAGLFLMVNANVNSALKILFCTARPFWVSTSIKHLAFDSTFGLPSGHAQNAVVFWGNIAAYLRKRWLWITLIAVIFLVGISRIYLAVHFPHDVLVGWLVGILMLWLFIRLSGPVTDWTLKLRLRNQILAILAFSLVLILIGFLARLAVSNFEVPGEWVAAAAESFPEEDPINPLDISGFISNAGAFFGLAAGACWIKTLGGYNASGSVAQRFGRYVLGALGVITIYLGLRAIFPQGETWLPYLLRFIRYGLIGLWVTALAPLLFIKIRLATHK